MNLYFLGTGAGIPSRMRNVSSFALTLPEYEGQTWLFDCGEATQHQILSSPVKLSKVSRIFITHLHGDHIFGLPGVLGSRSFQGAESPLTLYGPSGLRAFVDTALKTSQTYLRYPLEIIEVEHGYQFDDEHFRFTAGLLDHGVPSFGYRIEEKEQPGRLNVNRLKEMDIPPGPVYRRLKQGETVKLPDGRVIHGRDFLAPAKKGRKLAILGDTRLTTTCFELAKQADLLVHESTYRAGQEDMAQAFFHSTSAQAARVARESQVKTLILNHISSRFLPEECEEILAETREIFPDTYLAHDFWSYQLARS
ncbi:ribonuclease Z [Paenactinomyces guangxiensis]|uniref:Ribonuclease Z n=1 Tax=Paenactinomyces guangxiensis TaxID=1490290 RepID=A0A7W1WNZ5_9BACL|nr:ribonuclease Z [Paenactinomyces guangxiensis]MBA4493387.1 ribonuclease Z [Paenactinomyces guangxiensis]MBH8590477.1 ribonuclease Z [Paenactinomyces guangxiensis]